MRAGGLGLTPFLAVVDAGLEHLGRCSAACAAYIGRGATRQRARLIHWLAFSCGGAAGLRSPRIRKTWPLPLVSHLARRRLCSRRSRCASPRATCSRLSRSTSAAAHLPRARLSSSAPTPPTARDLTRVSAALGPDALAYPDTSALFKLIVPEPETAALRAELERWAQRVSSLLGQ
jgi:hypothetical protein